MPSCGELEAIWFGPLDAPLAGFLHHPRGLTRGGAVICPPLGYEDVCSHRTLRYLANRLAEQGIVTLRFDYEGEGSSSGPSGSPDALSQWRSSVAAAVQEMRALGVPSPSLIGLRLGAALACEALAHDELLGPLVLWAPLTSGRRAARELRALSLITPGSKGANDSLNVLGHAVDEKTLARLKTWRPLEGLPVSHPVLLVESRNWRDADSACEDLAAAGLRPRLVEVPGTAEVLERDAELVKAPVELVAAIVDWLGPQLDSARTDVAGAPRCPERSIASLGKTVRERLVTIPPRQLHAVLSLPEGGPGDSVALFLNNGVAPSRGPGRAWSEYARSLACSGIASLRLDLSGLGDSPDPPGPPVLQGQPVSPRASADAQQAIEWLRQRGYQRVVVIGLCSGGVISLLAASTGKLDADAIVAINAPLFAPRNVGGGPPVWTLWQAITWGTHRKRVRAQLHKLPGWVWRMLDGLRIFPSPARLLKGASRHVDDVTAIWAGGGEELVDIEIRSGTAVKRLAQEGVVDLRILPGMDHSLFDPTYRYQVLDIIREKCLGDPSARAATSRGA